MFQAGRQLSTASLWGSARRLEWCSSWWLGKLAFNVQAI